MFALTACLVHDDKLSVTLHHHECAVLFLLNDGATQPDGSLGTRLEVARSIFPTGGRTPDVERAHG